MWTSWTRYELWMSLSPYHKGMIADLYYLSQASIWRARRYYKSLFFHSSTIRWIKFKSMPMSLRGHFFLVYLRCESISSYHTWKSPESHISPLCDEVFLRMKDMNDVIISFGGKFFTRSIRDTEYILSELDRHNLRSETYPKIGYMIFTSITSCLDHTRNTS